MYAKVNQDICEGCGLCTSICPSVFSIQDNGTSQAIDDDISEHENEIQEILSICPQKALTIY